jgi:hypothetical protein
VPAVKKSSVIMQRSQPSHSLIFRAEYFAKLLVLLSLCSVVSAATFNPWQRRAPTLHSNVEPFSNGEFSKLCSARNLVISPKGKTLAFSDKDQLVFGDLGSAIEGATISLFNWPSAVASNVQLLEITDAQKITFLSDETALIMPNTGEAVFVRLSQRRWKREPPPSRFRPIFGLVNGPSITFQNASIELPSAAWLFRKDGDSLQPRVSSSFDGITGVVYSREHQYVISGDKGRYLKIFDNRGKIMDLDPRLDRFGFPSMTLYDGPSNQVYLADIGLVASIANGNMAILDVPAYSKPVSIAGGASLEFVHGPNNIQSLSGSGSDEIKVLKLEAANWIKLGWYIRSISIDRQTQRMAILFRAGDENDAAVSLLDPIVGPQRYTCKSQTDRDQSPSDGQNHLQNDSLTFKKWSPSSEKIDNPETNTIPPPIVGLRLIELADEFGSLPIWETIPKAPVVGRIVKLRGGPAANLRDLTFTNEQQNMINEQFC